MTKNIVESVCTEMMTKIRSPFASTYTNKYRVTKFVDRMDNFFFDLNGMYAESKRNYKELGLIILIRMYSFIHFILTRNGFLNKKK